MLALRCAKYNGTLAQVFVRYQQRLRETSECPNAPDAKAVIDDLTEEEFDVLTAVLGHLFVLNERFPKESEVRHLEDALRNFLSARRSPGSAGLAEPVMWSAPRTYRSLMERTLRT
jgi:hypothetical protein